MTQRLLSKMKWLLILAVYAGPNWNPVKGGSVKTPPKNPSTIEAQAKFFQYRHLPTSEDYEQGHRLGSEKHFTERHERSKPSEGLFSAKVRWGDKHGGYGEHYWDLNHAGHAADNDNGFESNSDDGSYREDDHNSDTYDEPSAYSPSYDDGYDPEKAAAYDESSRAKRAHTRTKPEKEIAQVEEENIENSDEEDEDVEEETEPPPPPPTKRKNAKTTNNNNRQKNEEVLKKTVTTKAQKSYESPQEKHPKIEDEKKQVVLVLSHKNKPAHKEENQQKPIQSPRQYQPTSQHPSSYVPYQDRSAAYQPTSKNPPSIVPNDDGSEAYQPTTKNPSNYVPYEGGSGVRQHKFVGASAPPQIPRLFLEPSTGHIVDRATGQAFVLQPISGAIYN